MKLKIRLKKRWITTVFREADTLKDPMPWIQAKKSRSSSSSGGVVPPKPRLVRV